MTVNASWLQDLNKMFGSLQTTINSAKTVYDLIPFIDKLFDEQSLKNKLLSLLDEEYQNEMRSHHHSTNKIRSLFISTNKMSGIPSDDIKANIISYLSPKDLSVIPIVSKIFNNIMNRYCHIYNDNNYQLAIEGDTEINDTEIIKDHKFDKRIYFCLSKKQKYIPTPFNQIKIWELFQVSHNILDILKKNAKNVHSLQLSHDDQNHLLQKISFSNCRVLISSRFVNCANFISLKYLNISTSTNDIYETLKYLPKSLCFLELIFNKITKNDNNNIISLKIPENIKLLKVDNDYTFSDDNYNDIGIAFDLSECDKLIGIMINDAMIDSIIWPKNYIIPFVKIVSQCHNARNESNILHRLKQQNCPILIIAFYCEIRIYSGDGEQYDHDIDPMTFDEIENRLKLNDKKFIKAFSKCMLIRDGSTFRKIMKMVIIDDKDRKKMILEIEQLIKLRANEWMIDMFDCYDF